MDNRVVQGVQQHQRNNGQRAGLGYVASFIEIQLNRAHAAQVDPLGKPARAAFSAEAGEAVYTFVAKASVSIAGRVMQHEQRVWNGFFKTKKREIEKLVHKDLPFNNCSYP